MTQIFCNELALSKANSSSPRYVQVLCVHMARVWQWGCRVASVRREQELHPCQTGRKEGSQAWEDGGHEGVWF